MADKSTRRQFLASSGAGVSWLTLAAPSLLSLGQLACNAQENGDALVTFTEREAADFAALANQILPSGDTPGASDAGVVYFADLALASPGPPAGMVEPLKAGLADLHERAMAIGTVPFPELPDEQQKAIVTEIETTPPFFMARALTLFGMFSHPKYRGNKDKLGWELIGLVDQHGWRPPFGEYDKDYDYEANYSKVNS